MVTRMEHSGSAPTTALSSPFAQGAGSFTVVDGTGYPDGASGQFTVTIDRTVAGVEETVLCESRSSNTFTVASGGRGYAGTADTAHSAAATVEHTFTAQEADDINTTLIDHEARIAAAETIGLYDDTAGYGAVTSGQTRVTSASLGDIVLPTARRLLVHWYASLSWDAAGQGWSVAGGVRLTPTDGGTAEADYVSSSRPVSSVAASQSSMAVTRAVTPVLAAGTYQVRAVCRAVSGPGGQGIAFSAPQVTLQGVVAP